VPETLERDRGRIEPPGQLDRAGGIAGRDGDLPDALIDEPLGGQLGHLPRAHEQHGFFAQIGEDLLGQLDRREADEGRGSEPEAIHGCHEHAAAARGGRPLRSPDPALEPEYSDSYSFSLDFDRPTTHSIYGFTLSGFYTRLQNTFILEEAGTDDQGNLQLEKSNGAGSRVYGLTLEARANWDNRLEFDAGFTLQRSLYDDPVTWSADAPGTTDYLRTPNRYGYYTLMLFNDRPLRLYLTGVYTGPMPVAHFGGAPGIDEDRLETSHDFLETNLKGSYDIDLGKGKGGLQIFGGVQNVFNAYQTDFDTGPNRDSNYVYGPARPRTFFMGLKWKSK